jgi:omega-6 fatty acid desaturase (delta-12 desaturase)
VGWALHSSLLVPFFSWKFTHHQHHSYTGHMSKDTAFVPVREEEPVSAFGGMLESLESMTEDAPVVSLLRLVVHQLFGWPLYLTLQITAGKGSDIYRRDRTNAWWNRSHFKPDSVLFQRHQFKYIVASDIGLGLTLAALYMLKQQMGWAMVFNLYGMPYLWVHHWLGKCCPCIADRATGTTPPGPPLT